MGTLLSHRESLRVGALVGAGTGGGRRREVPTVDTVLSFCPGPVVATLTCIVPLAPVRLMQVAAQQLARTDREMEVPRGPQGHVAGRSRVLALPLSGGHSGELRG